MSRWEYETRSLDVSTVEDPPGSVPPIMSYRRRLVGEWEWWEPTPGETAPYTSTTNAQTVVDEQSEDEGLWFVATTAPEAYLQQELRRLHAVIEGIDSEDTDGSD